jgi:hypothetical protein
MKSPDKKPNGTTNLTTGAGKSGKKSSVSLPDVDIPPEVVFRNLFK